MTLRTTTARTTQVLTPRKPLRLLGLCAAARLLPTGLAPLYLLG